MQYQKIQSVLRKIEPTGIQQDEVLYREDRCCQALDFVPWKASMMDWLHCNKCCALPDASIENHFYVKQCGHVLCTHCLLLYSCRVCGAKDVRHEPIGPNMSPDIKVFFQDNQEELSSIYNAYTFQMGHAKSLISTLNKQVAGFAEKWRKLIHEFQKIKKYLSKAEAENEELKTTLEMLRMNQQQEIMRREDVGFGFNNDGDGGFSTVGEHPSFFGNFGNVTMNSFMTPRTFKSTSSERVNMGNFPF